MQAREAIQSRFIGIMYFLANSSSLLVTQPPVEVFCHGLRCLREIIAILSVGSSATNGNDTSKKKNTKKKRFNTPPLPGAKKRVVDTSLLFYDFAHVTSLPNSLA